MALKWTYGSDAKLGRRRNYEFFFYKKKPVATSRMWKHAKMKIELDYCLLFFRGKNDDTWRRGQ